MEIEETRNEWEEAHRKRYWKSATIFLIIILLVVGGIVAGRTLKNIQNHRTTNPTQEK